MPITATGDAAVLEARIQSLHDTGLSEISEVRKYIALAAEEIASDDNINAVKCIGHLMLATVCLSKIMGTECLIAKEVMSAAVKDAAVVADALAEGPPSSLVAARQGG